MASWHTMWTFLHLWRENWHSHSLHLKVIQHYTLCCTSNTAQQWKLSSSMKSVRSCISISSVFHLNKLTAGRLKDMENIFILFCTNFLQYALWQLRSIFLNIGWFGTLFVMIWPISPPFNIVCLNGHSSPFLHVCLNVSCMFQQTLSISPNITCRIQVKYITEI